MAEYTLEALTPEDLEKLEEKDVLLFGTYPKEKDGEALPIEWEVLRKEDGKLFLLCVYGLDVMRFDTRPWEPFSKERIIWAGSSLRAWLNGEFWRTAFKEEERRLIAPTAFITDGDADRVSLLSYSEANGYVRGWRKSAELTPLANDKIMKEHESERHFGRRWDRGWWLRTTKDKDKAYCVVYDWAQESIKDNLYLDRQAVRPALWLDPHGDYPTDIASE